jgi:hypothetical protein
LLTDPSRDGPLPVLLAADLNVPPTTPKIQVLTEVMVDAWVAANGAAIPGHTMSTNNPLALREAGPLIDQRIDYVLARPGTPAHSVVVEQAFVAADPPGSNQTDEASEVSRQAPSGADQIDVEHQATDLAVGGSNPSRRAQHRRVQKLGGVR